MEDNNTLKVGTRYWLDGVKDISGVYDGKDERHIYFKDVENNYIYLVSDDGRLPLPVFYYHFEEVN